MITGKKSLVSMLLIVAMCLALLTACGVGADTTPKPNATNDPNMTAYDGKYAVDVDTSDLPATGELQVVPAEPAPDYTPTYFDSKPDAEAVEWELVTAMDVTIPSPLPSPTGKEIARDQYYSQLAITVPAGSDVGPASFLATNPNAGSGGYPSTNITLVATDRTNPDKANTTVENIVYQIFEPNASGVTILHSGTLPTVTAADNHDSRSYVTVLDGMGQSKTAGIVNNYAVAAGYLSSITVNGNTYTASGNDGWQYRVYNLSNGTYTVDSTNSTIFGAGDYKMSDNQLVQWRYGGYGTVTFPTSFPDPGIF
ncbi:MAG: DUF4430 domain-containing protein [Oscillospiraceae bacterium]|jgi:hypothetical protein|nr:DUF4430 domain-containing protein [Oscillospiraceae bacterium]